MIASIVLSYVESTFETAMDHWSEGAGGVLRRLLINCAQAMFHDYCPTWTPWAEVLYVDAAVKPAKEVPDVAELDLNVLHSWTGVMPFVEEPEDMYSARVDQAASYNLKIGDTVKRMAKTWMQPGLSTFKVRGSELTTLQSRRIAKALGMQRMKGEKISDHVTRAIDPEKYYEVNDHLLQEDWENFLFVCRDQYLYSS